MQYLVPVSTTVCRPLTYHTTCSHNTLSCYGLLATGDYRYATTDQRLGRLLLLCNKVGILTIRHFDGSDRAKFAITNCHMDYLIAWF